MNARKSTILASIAAAGLFAATLAVQPASAQVDFGIRINSAPPPNRYEVRPPIPGPGYVWTDGYYEPYNGRYRWHGGNWQRPPYEGGAYVHPHWDHYPDGWHMHEGYWAHEDHDPHYFDHYHDGHYDNRDDHRDDHHDDHHDNDHRDNPR